MNKPLGQTRNAKGRPHSRRRYVTTAIPYVNAAPHIGFAMEMVQADCLARLYRQQGHEVRFQAGADENSLKNVQAAEAESLSVEELVGRNAGQYLQLRETLSLSFDDFIRTSSDKRHRQGVEKLWLACAGRGDIYKRAYTGLYCTGCEQFYKADELTGGRCREHGTAPEVVSEENYFFRLSRYQDELKSLIVSDELCIFPESRRNEVLAVIDRGLEDFSISRSAERARGWGLAVPGDPDQVIYVWFDALGNYVTALDYDEEGDAFSDFWLSADRREHVIGKGITRFHAIYWPAMLLSAGLPLPSRVLVHGYVTVEGRKISKSTGNSVDPVPIAQQFGADALRYFLLRHVRGTEDGDFSEVRFRQAYKSDLAGQLGNLAHRSLSMIACYCDGVVPARHADDTAARELDEAGAELVSSVERNIESFAFQEALSDVWSFVARLNKYVTDAEPWSLAGTASTATDRSVAKKARADLETCLSNVAHGLAVAARCLWPVLPNTSKRLFEQLGADPAAWRKSHDITVTGNTVSPGSPLFPKVE